ncbi:MAG: hypothetical protein JXQ90_01950 [Cyclobacteriaceae bacterium]
MNQIMTDDLLYKSFVVQDGTTLTIKTVDLLVEDDYGLWVYLKSTGQTSSDEEWMKLEEFRAQIA